MPWKSPAEFRKLIRRRERTCWRCGQLIDWRIPHLDPYTGAVNRDSGTVEHKISIAQRPDLERDPGNMAASHWQCNHEAGDRHGRPGLGLRSKEW